MFKKSFFLLWMLCLICLPVWFLPAQIVPGQPRAVVETNSGSVLWEDETPVLPGQIHQILYAGHPHMGSIPVLALYVNDRLLLPVFFVSEDGYMQVMSRLQANPDLTQRPDNEYMLSFISADEQYCYKLSTSLIHGGELSAGLVDRETLMQHLPPSSAYVIMHVDYRIVKALGYHATQ